MGQFYVINSTGYPVRVTVTRLPPDPNIRRVILTSEAVEVKEKVIVQATISKTGHDRVLVPSTPDEFIVQVDNRIGATLQRGNDRQGNHLLTIVGFFS
ncbi:hypothetical protein KKF05_02605 [Patescibacteria group bacterium]|nr:hypothetical protein [Patescibacteria group bacterium]MBU1029006.1 hypothetical protein [Patescibacteria group bacterium]